MLYGCILRPEIWQGHNGISHPTLLDTGRVTVVDSAIRMIVLCIVEGVELGVGHGTWCAVVSHMVGDYVDHKVLVER